MILKNGIICEIRELDKSNAEQALCFLEQAAGESDFLTFGLGEFKMSLEQEEKFLENMKENENNLLLGAFVEGRLISIASLLTVSSYKRMQHRSQLGISILKAYWNLGLGTAIMEELLTFARSSKQLEIIELEVITENFAAIHLYEKFGFQIIGTYPRFSKVADKSYNAYYMVLDLAVL